MFSTCSELPPRTPILDGRMERIMQPCQTTREIKKHFGEIVTRDRLCVRSCYNHFFLSAKYLVFDNFFWRRFAFWVFLLIEENAVQKLVAEETPMKVYAIRSDLVQIR